MINDYYIEELKLLRAIAKDFSKENPAIAPMLGEPSADPDVERLLEGVAFLTGAIRQKIDDEFPEIIHDLLRQIWPHYLRPLPSATLIAFSPGEKLSESNLIPPGITADSVPVSGTICHFRTCTELNVHPLHIRDVAYMDPSGQHPWIRVSFRLEHGDVSGFRPGRLRLYLGGNYIDASDLYLELLTGLREIRIQAGGDENVCHLGPCHLKPMGFSDDEALIPWPSHAFEGYRLIQEYFLMPEKYLFVEVGGFDLWSPSTGSRDFHVDFVLDRAKTGAVKTGRHSFELFVTTAVNIFPHSAYPALSDHKKTDYPVRPSGYDQGKCQIYSIEKVSGVIESMNTEVTFADYHSFLSDDPPLVYHEKLSRNPVRDVVDFSVSLAYPGDMALPSMKSLSFDVLCTNGYLAENLGEGDIRFVHYGSPESISIKNIRKPTVAALPPLGSEALWRLTSALSLNLRSLTRPENLKSLLKLFIMEGYRDRINVRTNERKIQGIKGLEIKDVDRLIAGTLMRGMDVRLSLSRNHFAGAGDVYLFGSVLSHFLALQAPLNTFTRLVVIETDSGETLSWKERMGRQSLA